MWSENDVLVDDSKTAAQRGRVFRKHVAEGQKLVSIGYNFPTQLHYIQIRRAENDGIQGMVVLIGENITHDRSHRFLSASPTITPFFQHHCLGSPDEFLNHLQAFA